MIRYIVVLFAMLASFLVAGITKEEIMELKRVSAELDAKCQKEFGISVEEVKHNIDLSKIDPCYIACILKGQKLVDSKGMYDIKVAGGFVDKAIVSPDDIAKLKKIQEICSSVNEEAVSDGDKGCERSLLLLKCFMDQRGQMPAIITSA